jgi:hypothetical protein
MALLSVYQILNTQCIPEIVPSFASAVRRAFLQIHPSILSQEPEENKINFKTFSSI